MVNIDFAPTILNIAGVPIPADMQGKSVLPLVFSTGIPSGKGEKPKDWRKSMYYHYYEYPDAHRVMPHFGIRTERYKLIHFYGNGSSWELYDLKTDPDELMNVYDNAKNKALIGQLKKELRALMVEYKDDEALGVLHKAK